MADEVKLDFSKAQPIEATPPPVELDFSKAQPIQPQEVGVAAKKPPLGMPEQIAGGMKILGERALGTVGEVASGFGKGILDTTAGIGGLIQKIPGVGEKIIPQEGLTAEEKMAETTSTAEKVGKFAETVAEFAAGEEVLKGVVAVSRLSKIPGALELLEKYPKTAKLLTGAFKGGTVGGAQAAVKSGGKAEEAEAGAIGGAIGGAVGEAIAAAPKAAKAVGKLMGFGLNPEEAMVKAGRPAVSEATKFVESLDTALPRIEKFATDKIKKVGDFVDMLGDEAQAIRQKEFNPMIERAAAKGVVVPGKPIADEILSAVTPQMEKYEPAAAQAIKDFAKRFDKDMLIKEAEADLQYFNKKLAGYYKMGARDASRALELEPEIAKYEAAADAMRDQIYSRLESVGEKFSRKLQQQYGALKDLERTFAKRATIQDRQAPINLPQAIALMGGALEMGGAVLSGHPAQAIAGVLPIAAATLAKYRNSAESLIRTGIKAAQPEGIISGAAKELGSMAVGAAAKAAPVAGEQAGVDNVGPRIQFRASDGSIHEIPADQLDAARQIDPGLQMISGGKK